MPSFAAVATAKSCHHDMPSGRRRTDQMIAVNSAHAGLDLDRPYTSAEAEWIAWEVRHANRGTYVRPECGRKAANSYR